MASSHRSVMPGLEPGIHDFRCNKQSLMAGSSPAMTPSVCLIDRNEDGMAHPAAHRLRQVALAGNVLDQDDFAGADHPAFAVARRDLHPAVEVDDVLPARGRMPVEIIVAAGLAENDAGRGKPLRHQAAAPLLDPFDLDVAEVRVAPIVDVEI